MEIIAPRSGELIASEAVNVSAIVAGAITQRFFHGTRLGYRHITRPDGLPEVRIVEYVLVR
jgi:hypothetical protein